MYYTKKVKFAPHGGKGRGTDAGGGRAGSSAFLWRELCRDIYIPKTCKNTFVVAKVAIIRVTCKKLASYLLPPRLLHP